MGERYQKQEKFKVLILHSYISDNDGSSVALQGLLKDLDFIEEYKILTLRDATVNTDLNISTISNFEELERELTSNNYDIIHNFRLLGNSLIKWTIKSLKKNDLDIPIITTVNQRPSFVPTLLTPKEIKYSYRIVFIDRTAYSDPMVKEIPLERKVLNYYATSNNKKYIDTLYEEKNKIERKHNNIIFGRGSTLNKCPRDVIDIFEEIDIPNKEFRIYGVEPNSWLENLSKRYKNIITYPLQPINVWLKALSEFDIFLYQLPEDAYSSLDGILGAAMRLGIPVVYYGPEAPKERFKHYENGFIAKTKDEIVKYATLLAQDEKLRKKIGEAGRMSSLTQFDWRKTNKIYYDLYSSARANDHTRISLWYDIKYFYRKLKFKVINILKGN